MAQEKSRREAVVDHIVREKRWQTKQTKWEESRKQKEDGTVGGESCLEPLLEWWWVA